MIVWVKRLMITIAVLVAILFSLVGPIDYTPLADQDFYKSMQARLDSVQLDDHKTSKPFHSGWRKISITPGHPLPMAGYRLREQFETVHDSLYARIIVLVTDGQPIYLISVDLLLFPPTLKQKLEAYYAQRGNRPFLYLSATHTHNGAGCWHDSVAGNVILGHYEESWVEEVKNKIIGAIEDIENNLQTASIAYWEADAHEYAENRLKPGAPYDGMLRGLKLTQADHTTAHLITFSAHATSISKLSTSLSGDYPAAVVDSLMTATNSFGVFMAGMVGSHRLTGMSKKEFEMVAEAGELITKKIVSAAPSSKTDSINVIVAHVPIAFGPSQLRLTKKWKLRDWVFSWLLNPLHGELTYLQINDIILIGTPCDFSGEVFVNHIKDAAAIQNKKLIVTSFNGDYVGYITEDEHYDNLEKEEVMALNWVGPYYGTYFHEMINTLLKK
jgi:neutral ceramidase